MSKLILPPHAQTLRTYDELRRVALAFGDGCLNFMVLLGSPGTGKSRALADATGTSFHMMSGNATPFGLYQAAYEHRGERLVLDDCDGLFRDRQGVRLLKALCQSDREKSVCWLSDTKGLAGRGVPSQFITTSPVALISNDWTPANPDVLALQDRAHLFVFAPTSLEVHQHAAAFFWDQEIFDFIGEHLHLAQPHSLRTYVLAWQRKTAGMDWQELVLTRCVTGKLLAVLQIKADPSYTTEEQRAQAFIRGGHGSRATYFNIAKKVRPTESVPAMTVKGTPPVTSVTPPVRVLDLLRDRFGKLGEG